jgi:hypothetical protein
MTRDYRAANQALAQKLEEFDFDLGGPYVLIAPNGWREVCRAIIASWLMASKSAGSW